MTRIDPLNPAAIAHEISRLNELLEARTEEYASDVRDAAETDTVFKRRWAEEMVALAASRERPRSKEEREARVELAVTNDRAVAAIAEAKMKATKEALNSLRQQIDSLRSLGANVRAQT